MLSYPDYKTILLDFNGQVATISLNRPDIHNAINNELIDDVIDVFEKLNLEDDIRVIVLTGKGKTFCAGADLNWMKSVVDYTYRQNFEESLKLSKLMYLIYSHSKPVIAKVNGSALGGGVGLLATCDIVIASDEAKFAFTEVKLGLVPAVISPYIVARVGQARTGELFITGEKISAQRAVSFNLINRAVPFQDLDESVNSTVSAILRNGPIAVKIAKEIVQKVSVITNDEIKEFNAALIANLRLSAEGQEGMNAFLEKRKPAWQNESQ